MEPCENTSWILLSERHAAFPREVFAALTFLLSGCLIERLLSAPKGCHDGGFTKTRCQSLCPIYSQNDSIKPDCMALHVATVGGATPDAMALGHVGSNTRESRERSQHGNPELTDTRAEGIPKLKRDLWIEVTWLSKAAGFGLVREYVSPEPR